MSITYDTLEIFFTTIYLLHTIIILSFISLFTYYSRRYDHVRAKDIPNLWLIAISGLLHLWGLVTFNLHIYHTPDTAQICIVTGYVMQHLFGTNLWFYAIWNRLLKYGMIFYNFCECRGLRNPTWLVLTLTSVASMLPVLFFIVGISASGAVQPSEEDGMCYTDPTWKDVFILLTVVCFLLMIGSLCFIPKIIPNVYFNESKQLRDIVIFSSFTFLTEVWMNLKEVSSTEIGRHMSAVLVMAMHLFCLFRLCFYRLVRATQKDVNFERAFKDSIDLTRYQSETYVPKLLENGELLRDFIAFCDERYQDSYIEVCSVEIQDKKTPVRVGDAVEFIRDVTLFVDMTKNEDLWAKYNEIVKVYVATERGRKNVLGMDPSAVTRLITLHELAVTREIFDFEFKALIHVLHDKYFIFYKASGRYAPFIPDEATREQIVRRLETNGYISPVTNGAVPLDDDKDSEEMTSTFSIE